MKANDPDFKAIFNGNRIFRIPFFQRSYVWEEGNWKRFLEDMKSISSEGKAYFLGSLLLKDGGTMGNEYKILIDGQQRITTLIVFFKVLSLKKPEWKKYFNEDFLQRRNKEIMLRHNHIDKDVFEDIIAKDEIDDIAIKNQTEDKDSEEPVPKIIELYNYFVNNIEINDYDYVSITRKVQFISIELDANDDEQRIFDTTNSLGVRLTTGELLKNHLFDEDNLKSYEKNWKAIFEKDTEQKNYWDQVVVTGRIDRTNIDLFLYSLLQIKLHEKDSQIDPKVRTKLGQVKDLFENYKKFIEVSGIKDEQLVQDIREYAEIYYNNIKPDIEDVSLVAEAGIDRINAIIFGLDNSILIPYILYALKTTPRDEQQSLFSYLESYIVRRVVCKSDSKSYNRLFGSEFISHKINTLDKLKKYLNQKERGLEYMPNDVEVREGFHDSKINNRQTRAILYFIETKLRNHNKQSTAMHGLKHYSVEHLMPKAWEKNPNWGTFKEQDKIDERNRTLLTFGNLAIIRPGLNASIKNADWETKKYGKGKKAGLIEFAAGIESMHDALQKEVWSETEIKERANFLAEKALSYWPEQ